MFSSNRPELAMPYYRFLEEMIPEGRRRAKEELELVHPSLKGKSCRGLLFPVSALGIGGFYCTYWQQTVNAPFNVPLFSWYYEYTGDETFLRERQQGSALVIAVGIFAVGADRLWGFLRRLHSKRTIR